jgi:hypothetical protein
VDADNLVQRQCEKTERIIVPKVLFDSEGETAKIVQRVYLGRMDLRLVIGFLVEGHGGVNPLHGLFQPVELK